ncbi:protein kinase [Fervidobacterium sp. 2310opik-2]|uniref:serine/threonine protein kinase n=1 Tax=Fervidobacterium sp. 2310opik-2 TaxID=1755815 RepID=UPI0013DE7BF0|nr:protein kinase [Fervidobacterium sp. 2310opik-2]KAF2961324.1 hypothetical protein AS161_01905 [Fervidobacterium sp. 2310opik-2]
MKDEVLNIIKNGKNILLPKEIAGRYEIVDILSANTGFGLILIANDKKILGRKVLIKATNYKGKIKRTNLENASIIEKRRKEIEYEKNILAALNSIGLFNIPIIRDYVLGYNPTILWPEGNIIPGKQFLPEYAFNEPYIVLQYIEGTTLSNYVRENVKDKRSIEWQIEVLKLAKQLLKIFSMMHHTAKKKYNVSFIYQDLKPDNILISPNKSFTLIDFGGVAIKFEENGKIINRGVGTPGYMPPEVKDKTLPFDGRADLYSLGIMMFELLSDKPLENFINAKGLIDKLDFNSLDVEGSIVRIIQKATQSVAEKRYSNAKNMLKDVITALRILNTKRR